MYLGVTKTLTCRGCGEQYTATSTGRLPQWCSPQCKRDNGPKCKLCGDRAKSRELCAKHWTQDRVHGGPVATRICKQCGKRYQQPAEGRGRMRATCSNECAHARRTDHKARQDARLATTRCSAHGCDKPRRSIGADWCEMHYGRMRFTGSLERRRRGPNGVCHRCGETAAPRSLFCSKMCARRDRLKVPPHIGRLNCVVCMEPMDEGSRLDALYCSATCSDQYHRAKRYGVDAHELRAALERYSGCEICGRVNSEPVIDHDHGSGHVRGLICTQCNTGIGMLQDNPDVLRSAAKYLSERKINAELGWLNPKVQTAE